MNLMFKIWERVVCIAYKSKCRFVKWPTLWKVYIIKKILDCYLGVGIDWRLWYFSHKKFMSYKDYKEWVMMRPENMWAIWAIWAKEQDLYSIRYSSDFKPSREEYRKRYMTAWGWFKPISKNLAYECL